MGFKDQVERLEIVRMANGYMVRKPSDYRQAEVICISECYVFNDWAAAAQKMLEMLGGN